MNNAVSPIDLDDSRLAYACLAATANRAASTAAGDSRRTTPRRRDDGALAGGPGLPSALRRTLEVVGDGRVWRLEHDCARRRPTLTEVNSSPPAAAAVLSSD